MLWYSAFSLPWPMYSLVATLNCVTGMPLARLRISGSRVRRPVKRTLFTVGVLLLGRRTGIGSTLRVWRGSMRRATGGHGGATERAPAPAVGPSGGSADLRWSTDRRRSVDETGRCLAG